MPEPETRTRTPTIATGGAPRGARSRSQGDARRLASASACRAACTPGVPRVSAFTRVLTRYAPRVSRRSAPPRFGGRVQRNSQLGRKRVAGTKGAVRMARAKKSADEAADDLYAH